VKSLGTQPLGTQSLGTQPLGTQPLGAKLLIVRTGALGDVLHTLPAVADLKAQRPALQIDWAIDPRWEALLAGDGRPYIERTHIVPTRQWSAAPFSIATLRSVLALRKAIRAQHYDLVVDMQGTLRSAVIGRFASAKNFYGYADPREAIATKLYTQRIERRGIHVVEMNANLLGEAVGLALTPRAITLPRQQWAEDWAEREAVFKRPLAVLGAGGGWGAKHWPAARYGELARRLRTMGYDVAVNAPRADDAIANAVVEASAHAARAVVCDVAGLIALLRRTDLFIGGDSGPTHLAAALAVPTVALFGPTDPARNGPWPASKYAASQVRVLRDPASATSYKHTDAPDAHLSRLPVEAVLDAVWELNLPPAVRQ
jgi:heptosyltransferase-1